MSIIPFIMNITMEINFSSKVYFKSLLKVGSLKGSVVYSLILNYQFCACLIGIRTIPQLQTIHIKRLYRCDSLSTIHELTGVLLTYEFGQIWAEYVCHDVTPQLWQKSVGKRSIRGNSL